MSTLFEAITCGIIARIFGVGLIAFIVIFILLKLIGIL